MTRSQRIVILAWSLLDAIRQPATATGVISGQERRGETAGAWRLCGTCDGDRVVLDRFRRETQCPQCAGQGRYEVDPYTDQRVSTWLSPAPARVEHVGCSWCQPSHGEEGRGRWDSLPRGTGVYAGDRCVPCDGTGWRTFTAQDGDDPRSGRARFDLVAWTMRGDWPALTYALERLRGDDRPAYRAFLAETTHGEPRSETAVRGLALLEQTMPRRIHVPGQIVEAYELRDRRRADAEKARQRRLGRGHRNEAIRRLARAGRSSAEVARLTGVSERTVRRVA